MDRCNSPASVPAFLALSCIGFLATAPADAQAQPTPSADDKAVELKGVTVTDTAIDDTGYKAEPASTPRLTAPLIDTPRSIVVLGEQVIKETGSATLVDALRTVPGITFGAAEGGNPIGDRPFIRGFDSQGSIYQDGVRSIGSQSREVFAIDQVQVIRGSDSTLGGRGSAGGTINIISKLPGTDDFYHADGSFGTSAYKRITADVNRKLTDTIAVRLAAMWHDQDVAGRDAIFQKRWGISPSVTIGLGTPTRLTAAYYHLHTSELPDSGIPYTYVCTATICNAPAGMVRDRPAHGVTTLGGQTGTVSYDTLYGLTDRDFRKTNADEATLRVEHDFGGRVTLRNTARFDHTWQGYIYTQPDDSQGNVVGTTVTNAGTNFTNGGYVWRRANTRQGITNSLADQVDLTARLDTGILRHSIAAGLEWSIEETRRGTYALSSGSTVGPRCGAATVARFYCTSLFSPNPGDPFVNYASDTSTVATPITKSPGYADLLFKGDTRAAYLFDSISIGERIILNLGGRYNNYRSSVQPGLTAPTQTRYSLRRTDNTFTYQVGGIFKPTKDTSLYATYVTSANPPNSLIGEGSDTNALGTTNTALAINILDQLKVEKSKTIEVGGKVQLLHERLALNVAVFRTETTNARVQIDANTVSFVGKRRNQGVEFGFNGNITKAWSVFGGYSYLDAKIRDGGQTALTAAAVGAQPAQIVYVPSINTGKPFPQTAKHNFTIWTNYQLKRLSLGGGAFYTSRVYGGYGDNTRAVQTAAGAVTIIAPTSTIYRQVPGYWRLDARIGYKLTDFLDVSINVNNLTDKRYYSQAYLTHYASVAPGRYAFVTLSVHY